MKRISTLARKNMHEVFQNLNFTFSLGENDLYWREDVYYQFTLQQIERDIEAPTAELHHMCLDFCSDAVRSEKIMSSLGLDPSLFDPIRWSWDNREQDLYGRFDLAYNGTGPAKLLEYNADTPTSIYEAAILQWEWMEAQRNSGVLSSECDQYNSLHEQLVARFGKLPGNHWHFACMDNLEDRATVEYLADCAAQAGKSIRCILIDDIGLENPGSDTNGFGSIFVDNENQHIQNLFKLYPWEWIVKEDFGKNSYAMNSTRWHEPLWKMLLSNKGLLPNLWNRQPSHPNLLPSHFCSSTDKSTDGVIKPLLGREGANIRFVKDGVFVEDEGGVYDGQQCVWQQFADTRVGDHYTTIGSWLIGSRPSGMGVRENIGPIINNTSQFVPHIILE